jgi:hypothetical protein
VNNASAVFYQADWIMITIDEPGKHGFIMNTCVRVFVHIPMWMDIIDLFLSR